MAKSKKAIAVLSAVAGVTAAVAITASVLVSGPFKTVMDMYCGKETVELSFTEESLASYDYKNEKSYVLDAGEYHFYLSDNAHSWASLDKGDNAKVRSVNLTKKVYNETNKRECDEVAATNRFDAVSGEFKDTATSGYALNMSRKDFNGTFPTAPTAADMVAKDWIKSGIEAPFDEKADKKLGNVAGSKIYAEQAPASKKNNHIRLIDLRGADYDDYLWEQFLDQISYDTIVELVKNGGYNTKGITDLGKPATLDYDGPMGWSTWVSKNGDSAVCTSFPAEELLSATWNVDLAKEVGQMVGEQGLANGFNGWYAPAMNTHRNAFAGRNYEYFSEDGLPAGKIAAAEVGGAMDFGTYSYLKHFALNDKEDGRNGISTRANEQAIREIYLKPFEVCVKEAESVITYNDADGVSQTKTIKATTAIMSAYNCIGTTWSGGNYELLTEILRNEWGFNGAVISDYYGGDGYMDPDQAIRAGNDLMLNTFADATPGDVDSATAKTVLRNVAHNVMYMVVNSNALNGIASGSTVSYKLAGWQKVMIAADVVVGVADIAMLAAVATIIVKGKKA